MQFLLINFCSSIDPYQKCFPDSHAHSVFHGCAYAHAVQLHPQTFNGCSTSRNLRLGDGDGVATFTYKMKAMIMSMQLCEMRRSERKSTVPEKWKKIHDPYTVAKVQKSAKNCSQNNRNKHL